MKVRQVIKTEPGERIPPELVDAFFDRQLDEPSRDHFFALLRGDLGTCAKVARTQRIISTLREPVDAPDLTEAILEEVGQRRRFLALRDRRLVKYGRFAAATCLLLGLLGIAVLHRAAPEVFSFTKSERPLSRVVESGAQEAAAGVQQFAGAVEAVKARISEPAAELGRVLTAHDLPEIQCGPDLRAARVYVVGGLSADGVTVSPLLPGTSASSIPVYTGSGRGTPFFVPSVVYVEGPENRVVVPMQLSFGGRLPNWVGKWRQSVLLLHPPDSEAEPAEEHE
jgi:hypothetical protein